MKTINVREARQHLSEIIDAAERGEGCIITRRGKQVALIQPVEPVAPGRLPDMTAFCAFNHDLTRCSADRNLIRSAKQFGVKHRAIS